MSSARRASGSSAAASSLRYRMPTAPCAPTTAICAVGPQVLGAHDVVGAAVGLAGDHRDLGDGGLGVGVDQLGAAPDDALPLLGGPGEEAGHVDEGEHREIEGVAGADEAGGLLAGV